MKIKNTETTDITILQLGGWKYTSHNVPQTFISPPPSISQISIPTNFLDEESHKILLDESIKTFTEIWNSLADM